MDDASGVRRRKPVGDLPRVVNRLARRERALIEFRAQLLAVEQLGDDVGHAFVRADVVNREDVGMIKRRGRAGFLFKAPQTVGIKRE